MGRDRAAYMRDYRAKRRQSATITGDLSDPFGQEMMRLRVLQLEDEIARLKRELAARPPAGPSFNSKPFRPVPK
jgi:hypothetical protein